MSRTINSIQASPNNPVVANAYFDGTYDPTQGTVYRTGDVLSNLLDGYIIHFPHWNLFINEDRMRKTFPLNKARLKEITKKVEEGRIER